MSNKRTQRDVAIDILREHGIVRPMEFKTAGVTATTICRMLEDGDIVRLARGLYQLPNAPRDANHSLAEAAKRVPKGVVCLVSALAFHELTDQLPRAVWMAISINDSMPKPAGVQIRVVRFSGSKIFENIETHMIENVPVKVFGVAKTIADCFRHPSKFGPSTAIEGLQTAPASPEGNPGRDCAIRG